MKKYKLIKEYPGSPKLGTVVHNKRDPKWYHAVDNEDIFRGHNEIENHPEFWEEIVEYPIGTKAKNHFTQAIYTKEIDGWYTSSKTGYNDDSINKSKHITINKSKEVIEKDYEILSFKTPNNTSLMVGKTNLGWFTGIKEVGNNDFRSEEWLIKHNYLIESIRRLSDGEIFTVGDECNPIGEYSNNIGTIDKIEFCKAGYLRLASEKNWYMNINGIEHSKKPLDKDYEILSIKCDIKGFGDYILNKLPNGKFANEYKQYKQIEFDSKFYEIYQVKRLSDGEVFTIGDNIVFLAEKPHLNYRSNIKSFKVEQNTIYVSNPGYLIGSLKNIKHIKNPLFTTEDGVDIFKGDSYCKVNNHSNYSMVTGFVAEGAHDNYKGLKFSTKEAAEEYIVMNKPCLSINDVMNVAYNPVETRTSISNKLKEIVKSRL